MHLCDFLSLCIFICALKALAQEDAYSHWLHLFVFLCYTFFSFLFVFSYVSSKNHSTHSHIGCISVTSTVRFQMSPQIICMIERIALVAFVGVFPVCVLKCFLKLLASQDAQLHWVQLYFEETHESTQWGNIKQMHCHIGCIWLIFPHCVLSCVSSNYLSDGINSHTDCIHLICCQHLSFRSIITYPR